MRIRRIILPVVGLVLLSGVLVAQSMTVPANLQAAIFKKMLGFDKTLQSRGPIEVVVVYGDVAAKDEIVAAFKGVGVSASSVRADQISNGIGNASVLYVAPGAIPPKQFCANSGVLSLSGVASFVEKGQVSIGLGVEGGKPKILIHTGQLKAEGHDIASDILNMAKLIQ